MNNGKMSKSKGNVITVDEVVHGVSKVDDEYEFRNINSELIDPVNRAYKVDNSYRLYRRYGHHPIFLHRKSNPILPLVMGELQHANLLNYWRRLLLYQEKTMKRNPKQDGSSLFDCIPQKGPCPNQCNQCYYNRPGAFYLPINRPHFPSVEEVGDGIVRVNSGHDSNIQRDYVISSTEQYDKRFFNTSIPELGFPDPVVLTVNPKEEDSPELPSYFIYRNFNNLMFVRIRVSSTNLGFVTQAAKEWDKVGVPVVLTFMRYYDVEEYDEQKMEFYELRRHIINGYWCPTQIFIKATVAFVKQFNSEIKVCGTLCKNCNNCEFYYYEAKERMRNANTTTR